MSTADDATITLAAQIGQHRPNLKPALIARVAGKLVKVCVAIRKWDAKGGPHDFYQKAEALAKEVEGDFSTHIPYGESESNIDFYLTFDHTDHIEVDA